MAKKRNGEIINGLRQSIRPSPKQFKDGYNTRSIVRIVLREKLTQDLGGRDPFPTRGRQECRVERLGRLERAAAHVVRSSSDSCKVRFGTVELSRLEVHASERGAQFGARLLSDDKWLKQRRGRCKVLCPHI